MTVPKKTMKTVATVATKGGCGKTTITAHLAVEGARSRERVLILDADPQASCVLWSRLREAEHPTVEPIECNAVPQRLRQATSEGYTLCLIDTAPRATGTLATMLRVVDYVLVPLRPSAFDMGTLEQSLDIVTAAKAAGCIILSACPPRALEADEMRAELTDLALPLCSVTIGERTAFRRAIASGQAVTEFAPGGKAASEITSLWNYVRKGMQ
jgi:chromosome partitioning protein